MSKETTLCLKGIAILFMLLGHLFMGQEVSIDGEIITFTGTIYDHIRRCVNPVSFYLILGGYGLYKLNHKDGYRYDMHKRVCKLYIHYWLSLLIFVPIGVLVIGAEKYPGTFSVFVENITCWHLTYNHAMWFLLPYALITLTSPFVVRTLDRRPLLLCILSTLMMLGGAIETSRFNFEAFTEGHIPYVVKLYFVFLFTFLMGALLAKYNIVERIKLPTFIGVLLLAILVIIRSFITTSMVQSFYAATFIILFASIRRPSWIDNLLLAFGKKSTSMWFIHCYFCYYFFTEQLYSLRNPILMYIVLVFVTYVCALTLDFINSTVTKKLKL